jgi:hypothetical protein
MTQPSLRSVSYRLVSSAKRDRFTPVVWGVLFIYKLYSVGRQDGTLWHFCFYIFRRRHFAFHRDSERNELISLIRLVENSIVDNL